MAEGGGAEEEVFHFRKDFSRLGNPSFQIRGDPSALSWERWELTAREDLRAVGRAALLKRGGRRFPSCSRPRSLSPEPSGQPQG